MFNKLKEKLKSWTKNIAKDVEEPKEKEIDKRDLKKLSDKKIDEKLKKEVNKTKYKEPEKIFNVGLQKIVPKIEDQLLMKGVGERLKEYGEEIEKELEEKSSEKKESFFKKISSMPSKTKVSEKTFEIYAEELEMLLLENNVALEVAEKIIQELKDKIVGKELLKKEIEGQIQESFKDIIREILIEPFDLIKKIKEKSSKEKKPYVVLFCGINGTGKTTTIAKIAQQLKDNNLSCVLAAGDTFRAASIEQIKTHGKRLNINVIAHEYGSDPASVGFDAVKYAEKNKIDAVLIDTAGRMHTEKNLMAQIEKIAKVTKPDTKIFVGESLTGNDIIEQVKSFDWAIHLDGIILSKADIDEKGGTALSVGYVTKKPILYLGTGQEYEKIEPFDKEKFIKKLGLGD